MKKLILILIPLLVLIGVVYGVINDIKNDRDTTLTKYSIDVATDIVSLYRGKDGLNNIKKLDNKYISKDITVKINILNQELKSLNNVKFNVTEYYNSNYKVVEDRSYLSEYGSFVTEEEKLLAEQYMSEWREATSTKDNDSRIFTEGGVDYINVADLDFSKTGKDIITYKGVSFEITEDSVPETYEMMVSNPDNLYRYVTYKKSEENKYKYVDVLFNSIADETNTKIIRVFNNGKQITDYEVR